MSALDREHLSDARVDVPSVHMLEVPCLGTAVILIEGDLPVDFPCSALKPRMKWKS